MIFGYGICVVFTFVLSIFIIDETTWRKKMKTLRFSTFLACALAVVSYGVALADLTPQQIKTQFDGLGANGWSFNSSQSPEKVFSATNAASVPDLSAYIASTRGSGGTANYSFYSFCANGALGSTASGTATLSYNPTTGVSQNASGGVLSVGAAYLYKQYATGQLASFDYATLPQNAPRSTDASLLASALSILMTRNVTTINNAVPTNKYIAAMLQVNTAAYWANTYSLNQRYAEIGDYAVFIMNIRNASGASTQDFFYVAKADLGDGGQVPEPATLLLWSLGSIGTVGVGYYRQRNKKSSS